MDSIFKVPDADACGCGHHHGAGNRGRTSSVGAALVSVLACAVCPACLTTYAKLLSVFGMSVGTAPETHERLMGVALLVTISISAWRSWRTRRVWPFGAALSGALLALFGHAAELHAVEWAGMLVLLGGAIAEHLRSKSRLSIAA